VNKLPEPQEDDAVLPEELAAFILDPAATGSENFPDITHSSNITHHCSSLRPVFFK
jgi:hypothetical protein